MSASHDRMRDYLEGRLDAAAAEAFRREMEVDPLLAADVEDLRDLLERTAPAGEADPVSAVTFEDLVAREPSLSGGTPAPRPALRRLPVLPRRMAAAALVGVLTTAAALALPSWWRTSHPVTVALAAIPRAPVPIPEAPAAPVPDALASFRPVEEGRVRWVEALDEGRALARESGKPVLLFIHHPQCPMCLRLSTTEFNDASVQALLESFVPVKVDVMTAGVDEQRLATRGWPYLATLDASGAPLTEFPGMHDVEGMREALDRAREAAGGGGPDWESVRREAAAFRRAREADESGDLATAWTACDRVLAEAPDGRMGRRAAAMRARHLEAARVALGAAAAAPDAETALHLVEEQRRRWEGTPPAKDFETVGRALRDTGRFPVLTGEETPR